MKRIPTFSNYCATGNGRIWSSIARCFLDTHPLKDGYLGVTVLSDSDGKYISYPVHRLILLAFVGPLPKGKVSRHLDGNPTNNRISNLKYGTQRQNILDKWAHGTMCTEEKSHFAILTRSLVLELLTRWHGGSESTSVIGSVFGIHRDTVAQIVGCNSWKATNELFRDSWKGKLRPVPRKAKLTEDEVWNALEQYHLDHVEILPLANSLGISRINMTNLVTGRVWTHLYKEFAQQHPVRVPRKSSRADPQNRKNAILDFRAGKGTIAELCRQYNVPRSTLVTDLKT